MKDEGNTRSGNFEAATFEVRNMRSSPAASTALYHSALVRMQSPRRALPLSFVRLESPCMRSVVREVRMENTRRGGDVQRNGIDRYSPDHADC